MTTYLMDCFHCMNKVYTDHGEYCKPFLETGKDPCILEGDDGKTFVFSCKEEIKPQFTLINEEEEE